MHIFANCYVFQRKKSESIFVCNIDSVIICCWKQLCIWIYTSSIWEIIKTGAVKRREICANNSKILKILRSFFKKEKFNFKFFIFKFLFFEKFEKCMHGRWRKIDDRGCQIKRNVFKNGHKMATYHDTHTFIPLAKIDDFTRNWASIFGYWSLWKKNTRHFLWSREKPKNRWYFYVEMTSSSIVPLLFENPGSCGSLTENCCTRGFGAFGDSR